MKQKLLILCALAASSFTVKAANNGLDTAKAAPDAPLVFSGSVDTYFKYDFSKFKSTLKEAQVTGYPIGTSNIPTSFANEQNSISIGMIDLGLKKKVGKASFVGEVSFGPRGQEQSVPNASIATTSNLSGTAPNGYSASSYHIQNLYVSYDLTDKLNVTGGYMATFIGYEVISPVGNFNYSTSYLFTNGPFQNAGVKATYAFSDKASLMVGMFNDYWNIYQSKNDVSTFGAQLMVVPVKGWTAYLNVASGYASGTEFDLTTTYQVTDAFKLGLNAADFTTSKIVSLGQSGGFSGVALYPQFSVTKDVILGLRGEYFKAKTGTLGTAQPYSGITPGESVTALTATANIKAGPLTFIPEFRFDNGSKSIFVDGDGKATKSASQFLFAAVYAF